MGLMLTILGSSAAVPAHGRGLSGQILRLGSSLMLIDCGEGTQFQLSRFKIRRSQIDHVFISHMHGDHIFGLPGLIGSFALQGRKKPLKIIGPAGLESFVLSNLECSDLHLLFTLQFEVVDTSISKKILTIENMDVYSIPLDHRVPCTGYKFVEKRDYNILHGSIQALQLNYEQIKKLKKGKDIKLQNGEIIKFRDHTIPKRPGRSFAYVSDTKYKKGIIPVLQDVDVLFHESTYSHDMEKLAAKRFHSTSTQAARIAKAANAGKLILGHFSSRYGKVDPLVLEARTIFPETYAGLDGTTFDLDQ